MLGLAFYKEFKSEFKLKCSDIDVNEKWLSYLDFRNFKNYETDVKSFSPDFLFHLGAHTNLEFCEQNPEDTYLTNTESVKHAVRISNDLQIPLLYVSTAGIFDGNKDLYDESDTPNPLGHYAKSKYLAEIHVQEKSNEYIICRAGWMMGGGEKKDKKFIQKLLSQIKSGKKNLKVVNDKDGTPTYTHDFAKNCKALINTRNRGLFNMVCGGTTSRYEVALELLKIIGLQDEIYIDKVPSEYFKKDYFAERPACETLINKRLNDANLNLMNDWRISLSNYIKEYYKEY